MDVNQTITTNKALSSTFVRKQDQKPAGQAATDKERLSSVQQSLSALEEKLESEKSPEVRDQLELSYSSKKVELENLRSQASLKNVDDAQEKLKSFDQQLHSRTTLENVIQLDPARVNALIQ